MTETLERLRREVERARCSAYPRRELGRVLELCERAIAEAAESAAADRLFRIKIRGKRSREGNGDYLTRGPIVFDLEPGFCGSDVTPADPLTMTIKAPPHDIQIWDQDCTITIEHERNAR